MKKTSLLVMLLFATGLVFAQEKSGERSPDEQINVEKEYDENGNLIRFDSSYVRTWTDTSAVFGPEDFFGNDIQSFFSDSMFFGDGPFKELQEHFSQGQFFSPFNDWGSDSTLVLPQDSLHSFNGFGQMRQEMMKHFGQFFQNDSTMHNFEGFPGQQDFDFFFDQDDFDHLRKEMEEHFKQLQPENGTPQKMGASPQKI